MRPVENDVKTRMVYRRKARQLTYNPITNKPAQVLGVARPFLENSTAGSRHARHACENKTAPNGRQSERGLTTAIIGGSNG